MPTEFQKLLCNGDNKELLFELIEVTWINCKNIIGDWEVYIARSNSCVKFTREICSVSDVYVSRN